jgi:hypothetical protein
MIHGLLARGHRGHELRLLLHRRSRCPTCCSPSSSRSPPGPASRPLAPLDGGHHRGTSAAGSAGGRRHGAGPVDQGAGRGRPALAWPWSPSGGRNAEAAFGEALVLSALTSSSSRCWSLPWFGAMMTHGTAYLRPASSSTTTSSASRPIATTIPAPSGSTCPSSSGACCRGHRWHAALAAHLVGVFQTRRKVTERGMAGHPVGGRAVVFYSLSDWQAAAVHPADAAAAGAADGPCSVIARLARQMARGCNSASGAVAWGRHLSCRHPAAARPCCCTAPSRCSSRLDVAFAWCAPAIAWVPWRC